MCEIQTELSSTIRYQMGELMRYYPPSRETLRVWAGRAAEVETARDAAIELLTELSCATDIIAGISQYWALTREARERIANVIALLDGSAKEEGEDEAE